MSHRRVKPHRGIVAATANAPINMARNRGAVSVEAIKSRITPTSGWRPGVSRVETAGARQLAVKPFTTLPKGVLFLRLENFSTTKAAEDAGTLAKLS